MRKFIGSGTKRPPQDVETAIRDEEDPMTDAVSEPSSLIGEPAQRTQSNKTSSAVDDAESYHTAADIDHQSAIRYGLASLTIRSDSNSRLLSDEENEEMNKKIDRLMAVIDDRRPIHFAPDAETGEVEIYADHYDQVNDHDGFDLEQDIAANQENFGRIIRSGNGIRRIRSLNSLLYASSTDSWASTDSGKSSSNAWERAVAAANIRFALEHGRLDQEATVMRHPFRSSELESEPRQDRCLVRTISPIPLEYNRPIRTSTPSIHSIGSGLDTSSPLFRKSCERMLRDAYAEPPGSSFQREYPENSLDEWAFISEPRDKSLPEARESKAPTSTRRAFGVFEDASSGESSSKKVEKPAIRSKPLKDISNLRRPGYLQFNSFAKKARLGAHQTGAVDPAPASSVGFGGASNAESRRAYIKSKWPGLLEGRTMAETFRPDGIARRRNEQAIRRPIDTSHYSLSHVRTSLADSTLNVDSVRQAHFDLALARLEGRALPPQISPIERHPDLAALHDCDIQIEGSHRPLSLRGPRPRRPANPAPHRAFLRRFV